MQQQSKISSLASHMFHNPTCVADSVGQIVTIDDKPVHVCKTESAAKLLVLILNASKKASLTELLKLSTIVIRIESNPNNQFSMFDKVEA